jgi:hypothetical protein
MSDRFALDGRVAVIGGGVLCFASDASSSCSGQTLSMRGDLTAGRHVKLGDYR